MERASKRSATYLCRVSEPTLQGWLARLERRVAGLHAVRALVAGAGAGAATFAAAALVVGPISSRLTTTASWIAVVAAAATAAALTFRPALRLRGPRAATLLEPEGLSSSLRSALELATAGPGASVDLVSAHAASVRRALADVPPASVFPLRRVRHATTAAGLAALALGSLLLLASDRTRVGAWALMNPERLDDDGLVMADVITGARARLTFPGHFGREPVVLEDPARIEAPRGTSVELTLRPRVDVRRAVLRVVGTDLQMTRGADGALSARFVVRQDGPISARLEVQGAWVGEATPRRLAILPDEAPRASIVMPEADAVVGLHEEISIVWDAADDVGVRSADLVIGGADGRERRRSLGRWDDGVGEPIAAGAAAVVPSEVGAQPGDSFTVVVEARDGDVVSGPNLGRSEVRTLTVASESSRRAEEIADLAAVLDRGLHALADRLEREVLDEDPDGNARARFEAAHAGTAGFALGLDEIADGVESGDALRTMAHALRRQLTRERRLHGDRMGSRSARAAADAAVVDELERDVLALSDRLGRARLEDAAALAREIEALRRQMTSLLAELRRTDSPEARAALLAALARAQARMRELMERIARMGNDVPREFLNAESLPGLQTEDALEQLAAALEEDDLEAAARQLQELAHTLRQLAQALGAAEEEFSESRFGPRERAMAEALDALAGLEAEQRALSERSGETRRVAAERAIEAAGGRDGEGLARLARSARAIGESLHGISAGDLDAIEQEALSRARQRLVDIDDALSTQDIGEARRMALEAERDLEGLARDLELSALMFPGVDGEVSDGARATRRAARRLAELRQGIDQAIPRVSDFVDEGGRRQLRGDAPRQSAAAAAARGLVERFARGPDGTPLSPEGEQGVRDAHGSMGRARRALELGDPLEAATAQEEAARRLTELREELERTQRDPQGGGDGADRGGGGGDGGGLDFRRRVEIPEADAFEGPMEMRRRLLDAMREGAPAGYEESVRSYYEDLLR